MRFLYVLALIFGLTVFSNAQSSDKIILSGTVSKFNNDKVLKNVSVKAIGNNNQIFSGKSDKKGFYSLALPNGSYNIEFFKKKFKKNIYTNLIVDSTLSGNINLNTKLEVGKRQVIND